MEHEMNITMVKQNSNINFNAVYSKEPEMFYELYNLLCKNGKYKTGRDLAFDCKAVLTDNFKLLSDSYENELINKGVNDTEFLYAMRPDIILNKDETSLIKGFVEAINRAFKNNNSGEINKSTSELSEALKQIIQSSKLITTDAIKTQASNRKTKIISLDKEIETNLMA
jgi:hypothetical protein